MADEKTCPQCGAPLAAGAPEGLCRVCLLKLGLQSNTIAPTDAEILRRWTPPEPADLAANADITAAVSAVDLIEESHGAAGNVADLRRKVQANPDDRQARYDLSVALFAQGLTEGAIDELLAIVRAEREWNEQAARKQLVRIFDALGPTHPLTVSSRRRLSSILFS